MSAENLNEEPFKRQRLDSNEEEHPFKHLYEESFNNNENEIDLPPKNFVDLTNFVHDLAGSTEVSKTSEKDKDEFHIYKKTDHV